MNFFLRCGSVILTTLNLLIITAVSLIKFWLGLAVISLIILLLRTEMEEAPLTATILFNSFVILYVLVIIWWNFASFRDRLREFKSKGKGP